MLKLNFTDISYMTQGGNAVLIKAKLKKNNTFYALKCIPIEEEKHLDVTTEIEILSSMDHPNIVKYSGDFQVKIDIEELLNIYQVCLTPK